MFPDEVVKQLEELQFRDLKVVGLHFPTNEYGNRDAYTWDVRKNLALVGASAQDIDVEVAIRTYHEWFIIEPVAGIFES